MQSLPLTPYPEPALQFYPTESLIYKLNPKYLSRIRTVNPDIFEFEMINFIGMKAYNIFWKYIAHGAIYSSNDSLILRTSNDIRIFKCSIDKVKLTLYRHKGEEVEKLEDLIPYRDFYQFLDYFLEEFTGSVEPLHVDFAITRYYETLPIDITVTKTAFEQFEKLGHHQDLFLYISADIDKVITVIPAFFSRLQTLFINAYIFQVNSLVAPVLSNRRALHVAQNTIKTLASEREVACTVGMQRLHSFKMQDLRVKLGVGNIQYVANQRRFTEDPTSFLRIFIDYRENLPWIEVQIQGIGKPS